MADSILKKHQLDITVGVELNDAQRKATSAQIKNMASQWQDILDDAIKQGIEDGARSASLKDVLTQFNAQLKAFKLEPLTITVDELQIMDKPIEHAAKLVIQKLGNSFKGGGLGDIISSEITDSLDVLGGTVDKIYQKMEQNAKKSAKNIAKSMAEIAEVADQYTSKKSMRQIDKAISSNPKKSTAETNIKDMFKESVSARKSGASWDKQYLADVNFVKNYRKAGADTLKQIFGDQLSQVENYYNNLAKVHQQKIIALNDILAAKEFVGGSKKNPTQYQFKGEPWAREKTLQEVKQILSGGLTVKGDSSGTRSGDKDHGNPKNLNTSNPSDKTPSKTISQEKPKDVPKADTNAFNQNLFNAIESLSEKLQELNKQMFADETDDEEFDKIADKMSDLVENFSTQFKFNDPKKVAGELSFQSGRLEEWDSKIIYDSLSKRLSSEDPSWPKVKDSPATLEPIYNNSDLDEEKVWDAIDALRRIQSMAGEGITLDDAKEIHLFEGVASETDALKEYTRQLYLTEQEAEELYRDIQEYNRVIKEISDAKTNGHTKLGIPMSEVYENGNYGEYFSSEFENPTFVQTIDTIVNRLHGLAHDLAQTPQVDKDDIKNISRVDSSDSDSTPSTVLSETDAAALTNLNTTLSDLTNALNKESSDVTASIDATELSGVLHDGKPYIVDIQDHKDNTINKDAINSLFHEMSQLSHEKMGLLNSDTNVISDEFIIGGEKRAVGKFKKTNGYNTTFHNHPGVDVAAPSGTDLDMFVEQFAKFKKHLIVAGDEIASFDFSALSLDELKNIVNTIKDRFESDRYGIAYSQDIEQYKKNNQGKYSESELKTRAIDHAVNMFNQRIVKDVFTQHPGIMSIQSLDDFTRTQSGVSSDTNSQVFSKLIEVLGNLAASIKEAYPKVQDSTDVSKVDNTTADSTILTKLDETLGNLTIAITNFNGEKGESDNNNKVSVDTEGLQSVLTGITFKVQDISEKESVSNAIDQDSINNLANAIKTSIESQGSDDSAPWAREDTLNTTIKDLLNQIQVNTAKSASTEMIPTNTDVGNVLATENTLSSILKVVTAINEKTVKGSGKSSTSGTKKDNKAWNYDGSQYFPEKIKTRIGELAKLKAQLVSTGKLTDGIDTEIENLLRSLKTVKDGPDLSVWNEKFKQLKISIGIDKIWGDTQEKALKELDKLYSKLGQLEAREDLAGGKKQAEQYNAEMKAVYKKIDAQKQLLGIVDELDYRFNNIQQESANAEVDKIRRAQAKADDKATEQSVKDVYKLYEKLGVLQAEKRYSDAGSEEGKVLRQRIKDIQQEIALKQQGLIVDQQDLNLTRQLAFIKKENSISLQRARQTDADTVKEENKAIKELTSLYAQLGKQKAIVDSLDDGAEKDAAVSNLNATKNKIAEIYSRYMPDASTKKDLGSTKSDAYAEQSRIIANEKKISAEKKANKDATEAQSKAEREREKVVKELTSLYQKLGEQQAIIDSLGDGAEKDAALSNLDVTKDKISDVYRNYTPSISEQNDLDLAETAAYVEQSRIIENEKKIRAEKKATKDATKAQSTTEKERKKTIEEITSLYQKLGKLDAKIMTSVNDAEADTYREEIALLEELIALKSENLDIDQKEMDIQRADARRAAMRRADASQARKDFNQSIKDARRENRLNTANTNYNAGQKTLESLWKIDDDTIDISQISSVNQLQESLIQLETIYKKVDTTIKNGGVVDSKDADELQKQSAAVAKYRSEVEALIRNYEELSGDNVSFMGKFKPNEDLKRQLTDMVMQYTNGKAKIVDFDATTGKLRYTVKGAGREFTEYTAAVRGADGALVSVQGTTKKTESFLEASKRKLKEISSYVSATMVISRMGQELRKGIQYVREIDSALTELKKVTNETEETYDKFLDTAAKTADKVGSTIQKVVSSTADWARLNI